MANPVHPYIRSRDYAIAYKSRKKLRNEVLEVYGKECACCGETNPLFLTIDHIEGGGCAHRDSIKRYGTAFYTWLRKNNYPSGFQVLCYNCNSGRERNNGVCPHLYQLEII